MWECICDECGHEWEADTREVNGWNMPASDECPNCGNIDFIAVPPSELLSEETEPALMNFVFGGAKGDFTT